jgi:RimJ/RimL family protein N-acetyltransferase
VESKSRPYLRRAERMDLDTLIEWLDDGAFLGFLHGDETTAPKRLREQVSTMLGRAAVPLMAGGGLYIIDSAEHGPVGLVSLLDLAWRNRTCRFNFYLAQHARSRELEAESLHCTIRHCFYEMNLHRISRGVRQDDTEAARLMEEAGAKREAVLRRHVLVDGQPRDVYLYGLLRPEYRDPNGLVAADPGMQSAELRGA